MKIQPLLPEHFSEIREIYVLGIATGNATFETDAPAWEKWDQSHLPSCRLVTLDDNKNVVGWAALTPVSGRCVYAGVAEVSVYVHPAHSGQGIGRKLLQQLIHESEQQDLWTLQAGIFPENLASLKIHEQCGFRNVGYREKIGKMKGEWRKPFYWRDVVQPQGYEQKKYSFCLCGKFQPQPDGTGLCGNSWRRQSGCF